MWKPVQRLEHIGLELDTVEGMVERANKEVKVILQKKLQMKRVCRCLSWQVC